MGKQERIEIVTAAGEGLDTRRIVLSDELVEVLPGTVLMVIPGFKCVMHLRTAALAGEEAAGG